MFRRAEDDGPNKGKLDGRILAGVRPVCSRLLGRIANRQNETDVDAELLTF